MAEAWGHHRSLAVFVSESDDFCPRILSMNLLQNFERSIMAAIFHKHDLVRPSEGRKHAVIGVIQRHNTANGDRGSNA